VALANRLATDQGLEDALPALSVDELVAGLGGDETRTETTDVAGKTNERGSSLYVNGDSVLHRLAPRAKIALALGVFAVALAFDHPAWVVVPFAVSLGTLLALGGLKNLMRVWFVVVAIFVVGMVVWPAFVPGGPRRPRDAGDGRDPRRGAPRAGPPRPASRRSSSPACCCS